MESDRPEDGFTLIEVLIAVVIMGLAITVILGALGVLTKSAGLYRNQANVGTVLTNAAERLVDPGTTYVNCADTSTAGYQAAVQSGDLDSTSSTISVSKVEYSNGHSFPAGQTCRDTEDSGFRMQLITITVRSVEDQAVSTLQVIKHG